MNAKISVFVICVKVIIYLLLHNLHDCTFKRCPDCQKIFPLLSTFSMIIQVSVKSTYLAQSS